MPNWVIKQWPQRPACQEHQSPLSRCRLAFPTRDMFPLPTHQRRRSFSGRPVSSYTTPSSFQAKVEEEPGEQPIPTRAATRRFPVPLRWDAYWDSCDEVRLDDREGTFRVYRAGNSGPVVFCLHGGGYTGLTWSLTARALKDKCRVVAIDFRGHGESMTSDDGDLSAETLCADIVAIWNELFSKADSPSPTILVGHSMGGAIAVRAAATKQIGSLEGVIVIDVVEGTALGSLPCMLTLLQKRPPSFPSVESAVDWSLATRMSRNEEAACISMPSMLKESPAGGAYYVWRTALIESERYWSGWFTGLSEMFLTLEQPKLLVLVGTDRLDRTLTIGQMQGRFQMKVLPLAGHAIQEDEADEVADTVKLFLKTFRIGQKLPPFVQR